MDFTEYVDLIYAALCNIAWNKVVCLVCLFIYFFYEHPYDVNLTFQYGLV